MKQRSYASQFIKQCVFALLGVWFGENDIVILVCLLIYRTSNYSEYHECAKNAGNIVVNYVYGNNIDPIFRCRKCVCYKPAFR